MATGKWSSNIADRSFLEVADPEHMLALTSSVTIIAFICPNLVRVAGGQCVIGRWNNYNRQGYCLIITENGHLEFRIGKNDQDQSLQSQTPLQAQTWYFVAATFDDRDRSRYPTSRSDC